MRNHQPIARMELIGAVTASIDALTVNRAGPPTTPIMSLETVCNNTDEGILPEEHIVYVYILPCICFIGIVCNSLTLYVLRHKDFGGSLYTYLRTMAAADLATSILVLPFLLTRCQNCQRHGMTGYLRLFVELYIIVPGNNMSGTISNWVTMLLAIDRYCSRLSEERRALDREAEWSGRVEESERRRCGMGRARSARLYIVAISVLAVACNVHYFFSNRIVPQCNRLEPTAFGQSLAYTLFSWLKAILVMILPCIVLGVINLLMIVGSSKKSPASLTQTALHPSGYANHQVLLICVICLFLVGNMPIVFAFQGIARMFGDIASPSYKRYRMIANLLVAISYACNFFIYVVVDASFQQIFVTESCCSKWLRHKTYRAELDKTQAICTNSQDQVVSDLNTTHHLTSQEMTPSGNKLNVMASEPIREAFDEADPTEDIPLMCTGALQRHRDPDSDSFDTSRFAVTEVPTVS